MTENHSRGEDGRFKEKISDQDILKVFDRNEDPFLTAKEIAQNLPISKTAIQYRLEKMEEKNMVDRKKAGAHAVGWWAKVGPELSEEKKKLLKKEKNPK